MTDKYAVIGNPIAHSKSPQIHAAFAKQTHQDMTYEAILAPLDGFAITVEQLMQAGYQGLNVTVPFKFEAFEACSELSPRALHAGAVNTMQYHPQRGGWFGDNTDGTGLVNDILHNLKMEIAYKNVLLLGAGGAAQGVLLPLLNAHPASVCIANRTLEKAQAMVDKVGDISIVSANTFDRLQGHYEVVINATSAGLSDTVLPIPNAVFAKNGLAYEMMYGRETPFMAQARAAGAQVSDGLGMLVEQAAEAFYLWRGVRPSTASILTSLRSAS
jgi:shikimate dehydrogenase